MPLRTLAPLLAVALVGLAAPAWGIERCKARVHKKTGEIEVSARGVVGTPLWSGQDTPDNPFPGLAGCLKGGKLKKCLLGDEGTALSKRPPASCTLRVLDDTSQCEVHIQGCSPSTVVGTFVNQFGPSSYITQNSYGVLGVEKSAVGEFHVLFDRSVDDCIPQVSTLGGQAFVCAHCGLTDQHVRVNTADSDGNPEDLRFYLTLQCR